MKMSPFADGESPPSGEPSGAAGRLCPHGERGPIDGRVLVSRRQRALARDAACSRRDGGEGSGRFVKEFVESVQAGLATILEALSAAPQPASV